MEPKKEKIMEGVFLATALLSILVILLICLFLFVNGIPAMKEIGLFSFLSGTTWRPSNDIYGILPMILGSIYITAGALVVGVPIGVLTAVFLSHFAPPSIYRILSPMVHLLAGIPSVVYGFFGLSLLVPLTRKLFGGSGSSILTASLLLGMMILPTIITVSESALQAVPEIYYQGSLALGETHERSVFRTVVPAAKSGILSSIILGVGRAIGETMAVIMVAGNQARIPSSPLEGVRTLTANIVIEMGYAAELHRGALVATGVVLFVFILLINLIFAVVERGSKHD